MGTVEIAAFPDPPVFFKLLADDQRWRMVHALAKSDRRVNELVAMLAQPANLVSYHLRRLRGEELVRERRSSADGRDVFYSLNFLRLQRLLSSAGESLHPGLGRPDANEKMVLAKIPSGVRVLFLCTHNSARSQMAEGLLRAMTSGKVASFSAGTEVTRVHPLAIRAMAAEGINISKQHSKHLSEYVGQHFDYLITVCDRANESCPIFPGAPERIHWSIPDPSAAEGSEKRKQWAFEEALADLRTRIRYLLGILGHTGAAHS